MSVEILIENKLLKEPNFLFGKNKTGFLIILKDYNLEDKLEIENAILDTNCSIEFQDDNLTIKTESSYYVFNLRDYKHYFPENSFFLGFSFQDKDGSLIKEKVSMFQVKSYV